MTMPQDNKSSHRDKQKQHVAPVEPGQKEKGVGTKTTEARIWATANKLTRDGKEPLREKQELI